MPQSQSDTTVRNLQQVGLEMAESELVLVLTLHHFEVPRVIDETHAAMDQMALQRPKAGLGSTPIWTQMVNETST